MEAQGDEGTVRHRRKFVVLGTALPAASEARHSGHRLAPTGKGLPTRLPRSGLVQDPLAVSLKLFHSRTVVQCLMPDHNVLRARLYRLAELVELARQVPSKDRARMERMITQARQAVCEARRNEQQARMPSAMTRAIVMRLLVKGARPKTELRIMGDDISR
jgi:hypothetical protein